MVLSAKKVALESAISSHRDTYNAWAEQQDSMTLDDMFKNFMGAGEKEFIDPPQGLEREFKEYHGTSNYFLSHTKKRTEI